MLNQSASLEDRGERLSRIVGHLPLAGQSRLVKGVSLSPDCFNRLQTAVAVYLWHSLSQAHPQRSFSLSLDILEKRADEFTGLPNRTPNGLLLPRRETFLSFNMVQQALVAAMVDLNLPQFFEAFQSPCNIRIVSGQADAALDNRPYASSKVHTDVWYGEPLRSILFNLPLLGNPRAVAMDFLEPKSFPASLQKPLDDYEEGREVAAGAERLSMGFDLGVLYVSDSLSLHQTVRRGSGIRLSLDWRALPRERLASEANDEIRSRAVYMPTEAFLEAGTTLVFVDSDPLDAFLRRSRGEVVDRRNIQLVSVGSQ